MRVGSRTVLISSTVLVPDGEEAYLSKELDKDDELKCRLRFLHDASEESEKEQKIDYDFEDQLFTISFHNFNSSLGHSTAKPIYIGASNKNEPISFMATIHKLKSFTKIVIQFMMEEPS